MSKGPNAKFSALRAWHGGRRFLRHVFPSVAHQLGCAWEESRMALTGDDLAPDCRYRATRAVSIDAPVEVVWQWLTQLGQDRGGFYSYSWLENLFFADMRNADQIIPEYQRERRVGDTIWLANPKRYGGRGRMVVAALESYRSMALVMPEDAERLADGVPRAMDAGLFTFVLARRSYSPHRRSRSGNYSSLPQMLFDFLVFDPAHFVMERKMMLGIKERPNATISPTPPAAHATTRKTRARVPDPTDPPPPRGA